jgi:ATP-dependent Clp protease ATP-binding subunit ClpA
MRRVLNVLHASIKNNPMLVGEPGVGKPYLEGLAHVLYCDVPDNLKKNCFSLDMGR